jgi:hypothetical protein
MAHASQHWFLRGSDINASSSDNTSEEAVYLAAQPLSTVDDGQGWRVRCHWHWLEFC